MTAKGNFRERQEEELVALKSIFADECEDLHPNNEGPLNVKISLAPRKGSAQDAHVRCKLHIVCPPKYPKVVPKITLEESKGLSDVLLLELTKALETKANDMKGEVMIYDLTLIVQDFLSQHNTPPALSFYDEMLLQKTKREEDLRNLNEVKENKKRQVIRDEVMKRTQILRNEPRIRRDTRRSLSESSPTHQHSSTSESSEGSSPYFRSHMHPNECIEHRFSDTVYFQHVGRKVQRGCCLGHSAKGCVAYSAIDLDSGQLLYMTEWNIKYSQLEAKCVANCHRMIESKCNGGHTADDIIASIEKQVLNLAQFRHKNLINYECVMCIRKKEGIQIYLVQDFVHGTSVSSLSARLGWCAEGASMVAKGALDALIYLHNKGVTHNLLSESTCFMDNNGSIRVTDFALVPYLQDLIGDEKFSKGDLAALGALVESLSPTPPSEMRDFIEKCRSERILSGSDLIDHPFLHPSPIYEPSKQDESFNNQSVRPMPSTFPNFNAPVADRSRLQTEFEILQFLGKGAFGDVLKARNMLDNRQYAIKRIPLSARSRQLYKKMTREVELLSRLNHENVVRYYNSWIESAVNQDSQKINLEAGDWSVSHESCNPSGRVPKMLNQINDDDDDDDDEDSSEDDFINCIPNPVDSSSDGIEFINSNGEVVGFEDEEEESEAVNTIESNCKAKQLVQYMYIQMEFCEKSTLRTAIDMDLWTDRDRLWRFFREIAEGLSHIHQQGMIHRDLKPMNIFIDSRDQVKIGDFGLATTSLMALQSQENHPTPPQMEITHSLTGKVGTALYVAPELTGNASKSTYSQKVDLYSLGIILFEMSHPPLKTGMERIQILNAIRTSDIVIPTTLTYDGSYAQNVAVIRWLLDHDPSKRPTAEELLASELVPPAKVEENELQEMLRNALANPQSKSYKHLIARCLAQESDMVLELTYHMGLVLLSPTMEHVKNKVINLFRKHGAMEVITPLLSPCSKSAYTNFNPVRLMTHSGNIIFLPYDLRMPFVRHVAINGINSIRRYSVGRVYREKKVFNFHPKQLYECAFDIVTPSPGNLLVDAELISIAHEITNELPSLRQKVSIRINHTTLLRAILMHCNVPTSKYSEIFTNLLDFMDRKISKFQLLAALSLILVWPKLTTSALVDLLQTENLLGGEKGSMSGSNLKHLLRGRGEAASLAKGAIRELESVVTLVQGLGVTCPINLLAGLPIGYDRAKTGGIVWQMVAEEKSCRRGRPNVIAAGGRYDSVLTDFKRSAQATVHNVPERDISGAGFSFALDKLIQSIGTSHNLECSTIDVVVCVTGARPPLQDVTQILRALWNSGIRTGVVEAVNSEDTEDMAKDLGAAHIVLLGDGGALRLRSWDRDRFHERHVARPELIDTLLKMLKPDSVAVEPTQQVNVYSTNNSGKIVQHSTLPALNIILFTNEKLAANMKRRYETQLTQFMSTTLLLFEKKERITIVAVDLPGSVLGALTGAVDPREFTSKQAEEHLNQVIERYPRYKKYILEIHDQVIDILSERRNPSIVGLYSISDYSYRILL